MCFGGGQLALGLVGLTLGVLVLEVLKRVEDRWRQDRHAMLSVIIGTNGPTEKELTSKLQAEGYVISPWGVVSFDQNRQRELRQKCAGEHAHTKRILLRFCKKLSTIPEYSGWSGNHETGVRSQEPGVHNGRARMKVLEENHVRQTAVFSELQNTKTPGDFRALSRIPILTIVLPPKLDFSDCYFRRQSLLNS